MEERTTTTLNSAYYQAPHTDWWFGRNDGPDIADRRWHQHVACIDLRIEQNALGQNSIVLLGFACDEGVKRNLGRPGAVDGPQSLRQSLGTLPLAYPNIRIYDAGNIICDDGNLEEAQSNLGYAVSAILQAGAFPILLGGGHEITYGHYLGLRRHLNTQTADTLGIVNFDAHFDNRTPTNGTPTSGTGFYQIAEDCEIAQTPFHYLALGIQPTSNTTRLFDTAHQSGTRYIPAAGFEKNSCPIVDREIELLNSRSDAIYISIDMDVFAAPYAPGVSAPAHNGILPKGLFFDALNQLFESQKVISLDIAELNPVYDMDMRTSKLAAHIIAYAVDRLALEFVRKK